VIHVVSASRIRTPTGGLSALPFRLFSVPADITSDLLLACQVNVSELHLIVLPVTKHVQAMSRMAIVKRAGRR
jgi:hypothetical protein